MVDLTDMLPVDLRLRRTFARYGAALGLNAHAFAEDAVMTGLDVRTLLWREQEALERCAAMLLDALATTSASERAQLIERIRQTARRVAVLLDVSDEVGV